MRARTEGRDQQSADDHLQEIGTWLTSHRLLLCSVTRTSFHFVIDLNDFFKTRRMFAVVVVSLKFILLNSNISLVILFLLFNTEDSPVEQSPSWLEIECTKYYLFSW